MYMWKVFQGSADGTIRESLATRSQLVGDEVLLAVTAAGLCGTDQHFLNLKMTLGHEGIGHVQEVGPNVRMLQKGDRVGWGYQHDSCGLCKECFLGEEVDCSERNIYGETNLDQGAFATHAIWREAFLLRIPPDLTDAEAAPLMCAGCTVFSALKSASPAPGARVGVFGMGGLGHLAVQFASKQGFRVTVLSGASRKKEDAIKFGATEFYFVEEFLGLKIQEPLDILLVTTNEQADWHHMTEIMASRGRIIFLSILQGNISIPALPLVTRKLQVRGSVIAPRQCTIDMLRFASENHVTPQIRQFPLTTEGITEALGLMEAGFIEYRAVFIPTEISQCTHLDHLDCGQT